MQDNQRAEWILKQQTDLMREEERISRESQETEYDLWLKHGGNRTSRWAFTVLASSITV